MSFGVYIHWPFCRSKCPYCDFYSKVQKNVPQNEIIQTYLEDISYYAERTGKQNITSIFFGGGTPSLIDACNIEKIDEIVAKSLYVDNFKWQEETGNLYVGKKRAEGLENILYMCPCCKKEFSIKTDDDKIICTNCDTKVIYNQACHFDWEKEKYFNHIGEWYAYQNQIEKERHFQNKELNLTIPVQLKILAEKDTLIKESNDFEIRKTKRIENAGSGNLIITRERIFYKGVIFGENAEIRFNPRAVQYLPYTPGDNFQIYLQDVMFAFHPIDSRLCAKAALTIETLYEFLEQKAAEIV